MRVVSGTIDGKEVIHYEAPPSTIISQQMRNFFQWWKHSLDSIDGLLRAGVAHFYFVTIHSFDDGNGRIARALTDMALAQDEKIGTRLYSLSAQIIKNKKSYYDILEHCQKQTCDITLWLKWFLELVNRAIEESQENIQKVLYAAHFWKNHSHIDLNSRQRKVIQRLIEAWPLGFEGGLTNRKYVSLTRASRETVKRDLADLEKKGLIQRREGLGRSISYALKE